MNNYKLGLLGLALTLVVACSTESVDSPQEDIITQLQTQLDVAPEAQEPAEVLDHTKEGIYHGVVASGDTQSRGKVWLNLGNNTEATATITMVDGETLEFVGVKVVNDNVVAYNFAGEQGSFKVTESTVNKPEITEVVLNQVPYFMYTIKSTSQTRATAYTGTFEVTTNGSASGTWNILSNGASSPNQNFGTAISDLMVTLNGVMEMDTTFETGNFPCAGDTNWIPIVDVGEVAGDGIIAFDQTSSFFGGTVQWDLAYSLVGVFNNSTYFDLNCTQTGATTGSPFTYTNSTSGTVRSGTILIDLD